MHNTCYFHSESIFARHQPVGYPEISSASRWQAVSTSWCRLPRFTLKPRSALVLYIAETIFNEHRVEYFAGAGDSPSFAEAVATAFLEPFNNKLYSVASIIGNSNAIRLVAHTGLSTLTQPKDVFIDPVCASALIGTSHQTRAFVPLLANA